MQDSQREKTPPLFSFGKLIILWTNNADVFVL